MPSSCDLVIGFNDAVPFELVAIHRVTNCTVLYCTVLYCTVLYCTVLNSANSTEPAEPTNFTIC